MRTLRIVINMLKCSSLQLMGSDWDMDGKGLIFFKGLVGTGFLEFDHCSSDIWTTQIGPFFSFSFSSSSYFFWGG